jgi:hypothetical protein
VAPQGGRGPRTGKPSFRGVTPSAEYRAQVPPLQNISFFDTVARLLHSMWTGQALPFILPLLTFFHRSQRCMDRAVTCQTPPRGLSISRTSRNLNGDFIPVTISKRPVLAVTSSPLATKAIIAPYMIWAIEPPGVRLTSWCRLHPIIAQRVRSISTSISPIWPHPVAITPIASSLWPCAWWSKMVCPPDPRVGTSGVITGFLSLLPRSKIGER